MCWLVLALQFVIVCWGAFPGYSLVLSVSYVVLLVLLRGKLFVVVCLCVGRGLM